MWAHRPRASGAGVPRSPGSVRPTSPSELLTWGKGDDLTCRVEARRTSMAVIFLASLAQPHAVHAFVWLGCSAFFERQPVAVELRPPQQLGSVFPWPATGSAQMLATSVPTY